MLGSTIDFLLPMLRHLLGQQAELEVTRRMTNAEVFVCQGMRSKGFDLLGVSVAVLSRDALFRLFKAVVKSGDLADICRDAIDQTAVPLVAARNPQTLEDVVQLTREAAVKVIFHGGK